eukprot:scpid84091/ scgid7603/ 
MCVLVQKVGIWIHARARCLCTSKPMYFAIGGHKAPAARAGEAMTETRWCVAITAVRTKHSWGLVSFLVLSANLFLKLRVLLEKTVILSVGTLCLGFDGL